MSEHTIAYTTAVLVSLALVVFLWRYLGWWKTLLLVLAITAVDSDHFLFGSQGFLETPVPGEKILYAFNYGIEFTAIVLGFNLITGKHTLRLGIKTWLFPRIEVYISKSSYYFTWTVRIILLGTLVHYAMDLPIYVILDKWNYYDYSAIHYLLTSAH